MRKKVPIESELRKDLFDPDKTPELLTVAQSAEILGVSRTTVSRLLTSGELQSIRLGRAHGVPVHALRIRVAGRIFTELLNRSEERN